MASSVEINSKIAIPVSELQFTFSRASGPGGQNVNKVNSKATLHWHPASSRVLTPAISERVLAALANRLTNDGYLVIYSQKYRDQGKNVADCLHKLKLILVDALRIPKRRKPTRPPASAKRRRLADKKKTAEKKLLRQSPLG